MPILLLGLALVAFQDDAAALIQKLRSEIPEVRETATKQLRELGESARPALEKAVMDPDAEVAARVTYLLRILQLKKELTPNLQAVIPDAVDRLAKGGGHNWTTVLLEATDTDKEGNRRLPSIVRGDLVALAAHAIRGAESSEEKIRTCWIASNWRLKSAFPEMQKLQGDGDPHVRFRTLVWCIVLGGRDAAPKAADLLKDADVKVRQQAAHHLTFIGTKEQIKELQVALKDPDPTVQLNAARALGKLGDRTAVDFILPLLDTNLRASAAWALGELGCTEQAENVAALLKEEGSRLDALRALELLDARDRVETIAKYLDGSGPGTAGHAAMVLANLRARAFSDRIANLVRNKVPGNYGQAIRALGRMGDPRQAKTLVPMLKDGSNYLRADAAEALALLDAREFAGDIASLLEDADIHARSHGALALGKLASRLPDADRKPWLEALRPLEKDPSEAVRFAASISLIRSGAKNPAETLDVVRRLDSTWFEAWESLAAECVLALTQLHEPAGFGKLMREVELKRVVDSADSLAAALEDAGLKLLSREELFLRGRMGPGRVIRPQDLLEGMIVPDAYRVIVEKDTLRIVWRDAALEYWLKRLQRN